SKVTPAVQLLRLVGALTSLSANVWSAGIRIRSSGTGPHSPPLRLLKPSPTIGVNVPAPSAVASVPLVPEALAVLPVMADAPVPMACGSGGVAVAVPQGDALRAAAR